ncbi:hypothetical protein CWI37_1403p0010 [Hamiltosporidium tvaerminnensis]|uniref:Uncharacterized protein n=1 Tax=Hamiltosporidium tvaerminnensis TaxID=1176355 RepID=A0A4Q9KXZ0_9MICR|nr:hypothetical protein LUQ84_3509 [Hamiltosporidium tvaerminnensis]TBT99270.1 hypothetical protein CWI37_1403p0010 [Hamiltosporidium tvaerminnensis]
MLIKRILTATDVVRFKLLYDLIYVLFSAKIIGNVRSRNSTIRFQTNENFEILFFENKYEQNFSEYVSYGDYELKIITGSYEDLDDDTQPFFIYNNENFVDFELFNNILLYNKPENEYKIGIIKCNYDLSYYLRLTKDISIVSNLLNGYQFKCILIMLKHLKAVENQNLAKFLQALIPENLYDEIINVLMLKNHYLHIEEILSCDFFADVDLNIKRKLILGFLNKLMIKGDFYDGNLILYDKHNEDYDVSLLDNDIPQKNLLINSFKIFISLENILKDFCNHNILRIIFNDLNIKSLILNNFISDMIPSDDFAPIVLSIPSFTSITLSNVRLPTSPDLLCYTLRNINNNIEFLRLENTKTYGFNFMNIFNEKKLRGLVLRAVKLHEYTSSFDDWSNFYEKLEFIDFRSVFINSLWWKHFFQKANLNKIIVHFSDLNSEKSFLDEFVKITTSKINFFHLEIRFNYSELEINFLLSLIYFKYLRTLTLDGYRISNDNVMLLYQAIDSMKDLECLELCRYEDNTKPYDFLPDKLKLKSLNLQNIFLNNEIILILFFQSHRFITELSLKNVVLSSDCLKEIFKCENLIQLSLDISISNPDVYYESADFLSKNINRLSLRNPCYIFTQGFDMLSKLESLEFISISSCGFRTGYISMLNSKSALSLKTLSYRFSTLDSNDINKITGFKILKELNLFGCKFQNYTFLNFLNECEFFKSLKTLEFWVIGMKNDDFKGLKRFRKLKELSFKFSEFDLLKINNCIFSLPISLIHNLDSNNEKNHMVFSRYLSESNVKVK